MSNVIKLKNRARISLGGELSEAELVQQAGATPLEQKTHEFELQKQFQVGFSQGYEVARKELEAQFSNAIMQKTEEFYAILSSFEDKLRGYETIYDTLVIRLATLIAEKIVQREISIHSTVEATLRESIKKVIGANEVFIKINPEDYALLMNEGKTAIIEKSFDKIKFEVTDKIEAGGCIIETEIGSVDARIDSQLKEIANELLNSIVHNV